MPGILITGGTGSFGQALVKYLLSVDIYDRIVVYSRGEHKQEEMARNISDRRMRYFIGDVRDKPRLEMAMRGIKDVVHAAALKIVPTCEYNPFEAVSTNVVGAQNVIEASIKNGVERVVALSTDKACHPINLYGATKLTAEKLFISANYLSAEKTKFNVVRYGNVVRSNGSVIPLFEKLIKDGIDKLPITDPRMTRFWITLDEAVETALIGLHSPGRQILVPKIPSFRLIDLAEAMGMSYNIVGIRPGEKLHETLITEDESCFAFMHPNKRHWLILTERVHDPVMSIGYNSYKNNYLTIDQIKEGLSR